MRDRRPDGYHTLDSLAVFAPHAADRLQLRPSPDLSLTLSGPFAAALTADPDNLVLRAARALAAFLPTQAGAALHLEKNLPVASGIGGGSADAAAALRGLADLWAIPPALRDTLPRLAARLGADIPICLAARPCQMGGIGEILEPVTLPDYALLLVNPGIGLATQAVFSALPRPLGRPPRQLPMLADAQALAAWLRTTENDLQAPAISLCPEIAVVLAAIGATPACLLARMSGSGATCFGLYPSRAAARIAAGLIPNRWWHAA